jgi:hypothetical protein
MRGASQSGLSQLFIRISRILAGTAGDTETGLPAPPLRLDGISTKSSSRSPVDKCIYGAPSMMKAKSSTYSSKHVLPAHQYLCGGAENRLEFPVLENDHILRRAQKLCWIDRPRLGRLRASLFFNQCLLWDRKTRLGGEASSEQPHP